jgi:hypothetical protein
LSSRLTRHLLRRPTHQHQINRLIDPRRTGHAAKAGGERQLNRLSNPTNLNITDRSASIQHQLNGFVQPGNAAERFAGRQAQLNRLAQPVLSLKGITSHQAQLNHPGDA